MSSIAAVRLDFSTCWMTGPWRSPTTGGTVSTFPSVIWLPDDRAALILMDYPGRRRLKMYGHVEARSLVDHPELAERLAMPGYKAKVERALLVHLAAFDWNCPQHITPRFSEPELADALAPIRQRIEELEAENKRLQQQLAGGTVGNTA